MNLKVKAVCSKRERRFGKSVEVLYFLGVVSLQLACLDVLKQRERALFLLVELGRSQGRK